MSGALVAAASAPATAAPAQDASTLGVAKATAVVLEYAPTMGNLELAITSGAAVSEVRNQLAQSQSQSLDLGLIGSTLTAVQCDGDDPPLRPNQLPQPIRIDNRSGEATAEASSTDLGESFSGGHQWVRATPQPRSEAVTTAAVLDLPGFVQVAGGQASVLTEVLDGGAARVAQSGVDVNFEIPGLVRLSGMRWDAFHRTGTEPSAHAGFSFGTVELFGVPVPTEGVPAEAVVDSLNAALGPLGMTFGAPVVERFTEPADVVRVTPLRVRFGDSPISALLLAPILEGSRQIRDDLVAMVIDAYCRTASFFVIGEIALGQVSGVGSTVIDLGGAEATTGLVALENPFGAGGLLAPTVDLPSPDLATDPTTGEASAGVAPAVSPDSPLAAPTTGAITTAPVGTFERVCESVHPFRWPSCSSGAAPFVGLAAIAATAGIGLLDWRHQRRRSRASDVVEAAS